VNRYRFIAEEKAQYSVAQLCRVLEVAPSGYYAWRHRPPSPRAVANALLTEQIRAIHERSRCTYGAPRVHADLRARKKRVSRKRVARLMRKAGLVGHLPRRFRRTTVTDQKVQIEDLVQRQFTAAAPDRKWFGDITYIRTWEGWLYLAVILDAYSRKVVGWAMADHLRTELATDALEMALTSRRPRPGLIHHTDRGAQAGFKGSSQHCRKELRCTNQSGDDQIGRYEPGCDRQVVRQSLVGRIGNVSGRQSPEA
jgi:putative transposase